LGLFRKSGSHFVRQSLTLYPESVFKVPTRLPVFVVVKSNFNVEFAGFQEYMAPIGKIKASKVLVLPSSRGGFGMVNRSFCLRSAGSDCEGKVQMRLRDWSKIEWMGLLRNLGIEKLRKG
jgi:hypothetical protein